jgi:hypothetical protein
MHRTNNIKMATVFYLTASVKETVTVHIQRWIAIPVEWLRQCVHGNGRYLTTGTAASKYEISLRDNWGMHATEMCRSKGARLRNFRSQAKNLCVVIGTF